MTEAEELAQTFPKCKTFSEACELIERMIPNWRDLWGFQMHDNIAEAMVCFY